jgi:hypothetical protein
MSGWVGQRTCAECGHEGPEPDFTAMGLTEFGDPYVIARAIAGAFDITICHGCAELLTKMPREAMARAIVRLIRQQMAGAGV